MKHAAISVAVDAVGAVRQQAKMHMHLGGGGGGGKATTFQFWRWVVLLMIVGSTLAVGMWGVLAGFGDFIMIQQDASVLVQGTGVTRLNNEEEEEVDNSQCAGRRVYMYDLPKQFNADVLDTFCLEEYDWLHMCDTFINKGFGLNLEHVMDPIDSWYRTEQFALEVILHERFKEYPCLTDNPEIADLFYMPYYVGLELSFNIFNNEVQLLDLLLERFVGWLLAQPSWTRSQGNNHFMALSRIVWDFTRPVQTGGWGNSLLNTFELQNVTKVMIERIPNSDFSQMAIPYPTSFHPGSDMELEMWQKKVSETKRELLVSIAGAPRNTTRHPGLLVRDILFEQCTGSEQCKVLLCSRYEDHVDCPKYPNLITELFLSSTFCLQPAGDSPTRKGVFDCLLAGSIPVFFCPDTAYTQYLWHLPADGSSYSVLIDEAELLNTRMNVIDMLAKIPESQVKQMQAVILETIIPSIVYDQPGRDPSKKTKDAFDITLDHILEINSQRSTESVQSPSESESAINETDP